jgi:hypothetical protein
VSDGGSATTDNSSDGRATLLVRGAEHAAETACTEMACGNDKTDRVKSYNYKYAQGER